MIDYLEYNGNNLIFNEINDEITSIMYNNNGNIQKLMFQTPIMRVPFGIEENYDNLTLKLEFSNYKENIIMDKFFEFIKTLENDINKYLSDKNLEFYSQLRINKYDPLISLKILKSKNQILTEFCDNDRFLIYSDIKKNNKIICNILIDNIWKSKKNYTAKFKVKKILKYNCV